MQTANSLVFRCITAARDQARVRAFPLSILSVGRDRELLRQREEAIRSRSDLPVRSMTPEEAESLTRSPKGYVWIFCASIELSRMVYLACSVRRYSRESRLVLDGARKVGFERSLFHRIVRAEDPEETLLDAVSCLAVAA